MKIYVCTHKAFTPPPDPLYVPLQVGAGCAGRDDLGMLRDDTGDNITLKNPYYSELTGMYWAWKNDRDSKILGLCHYRRYLLDAHGKLFTKETLRAALSSYDAITTKQIVLDYTYREAFGGKHNPRDFALLEAAVAARAPAYLPAFRALADGRRTYFGNMLYAGRSFFTDYATWLFDLLAAVEREVDMTGYNEYQKRLYGFLSELLLMVYLHRHGARVLECGVAVMGGKKETEEAIAAIAAFFRAGDADGAARYYMELYRRRPDILMEASDTRGTLKLITQMLATFQAEWEQTGHNGLERERDMGTLLMQFQALNDDIQAGRMPDTPLSETAVAIARKLYHAS